MIDLVNFLKWCTILNGSLLVFWTLCILAVPDLVYRTQSRFLPLSRETYNVAMYAFLGAFKILFLFLNAVPFIVLLILAD
ncbi:MAG: hypothetical protein H7A21_07715 [Spirochaetales bacterium]|nr:hypothetical protein [Leptospiraceae bacterium]MCP5481301.1 hypothetical protein [Spirochaetales bacterium]MCP5485737.1 hypothetical protein [Spirochaetales bacterium]